MGVQRSNGCRGAAALLVVLTSLAIVPAEASAAARDTATACPTGIPEDGLTDVPASNVHERAIDCVSYLDLADVRRLNTYRPGDPMTRGQMASFVSDLLRQVGVELAAGTDRFTDDEGHPDEGSINRLAAAGIVNGVSPGRFAPNAPVTRGQMTAFLIRAYVLATGRSSSGHPDAFTDDQGTTHEATTNAAAALGIAGGFGDGTFRPSVAVRRDQMASFIVRDLDAILDTGVGEPTGIRRGELLPIESWDGFESMGFDAAYECGRKAARALADRRPRISSPSVTSADIAEVGQIDFSFGQGAGASHADGVRSHLEVPASLLRASGDVDLDPIWIWITSSREEMVDEYARHYGISEDQARATIGMTSETNPGAVGKGGLFLLTSAAEATPFNAGFLAHELFHVVQFGLVGGDLIRVPDSETPIGGPRWLIEGSAVVFDREATASGATTTLDMSPFLDFWAAIGDGDTWTVAFRDAWGMTAEEFYTSFDAAGGC